MLKCMDSGPLLCGNPNRAASKVPDIAKGTTKETSAIKKSKEHQRLGEELRSQRG